MKKSLFLIVAVLLGGLPACGSSSGGGDDDTSVQTDSQAPPEKTELPQVTKQSTQTLEEFMALVNQTPGLLAVWNALKTKGATAFLRSGVSQDEDGVTVQWGEATEGGTSTGVLHRCKGETCVDAWYFVDNQKLILSDATGKDVALEGIGLPILRKQLAGHTYDKPTEVITQSLELPTQMPTIDVTKRNAWLVSSFGDLWASGELGLDGLEGLLKETGAFDSVRQVQYAQMAHLDDILLHGHPYDVLVWLGQTVREEVKTNEVFMPVGMTVNSGVFGDKLYDRERLTKVLALNPLQGPGVVVLAACDSIDDGAGGGDREKSLPRALDNGARVVVGFVKCGDARDVLYASQLFLAAYLDQGQTLGLAVATANAYLEGLDGKLRMATLPDANLENRFLKETGGFWDAYTTAGLPGDSFLTVYLNVVNLCTRPDSSTYQEDESFATAWTKEVKWQGPFFTGTRVNQANNVNVTITGALTALGEHEHLFFELKGDLGPKVKGLTVYGNGDIKKIVLDKEKPDEFTVEFAGQGKASQYTNAEGHTCIMQDPYLTTSTGEPSKFVIPVPWKAQ